jgi:hypothetical protein
VRLLILLLGSLACQACNTFYHARIPQETPESATTGETIAHCLTSLGFKDVSHEDYNRESIAQEPDLIATWSRSAGSIWSGSAETAASLWQEGAQWRVTFVSRNSSLTAEVLSEAFVACLPEHEPAITVETNSEGFLDLR